MTPSELENALFNQYKIHTVGIVWENISCVRVTPHAQTTLPIWISWSPPFRHLLWHEGVEAFHSSIRARMISFESDCDARERSASNRLWDYVFNSRAGQLDLPEKPRMEDGWSTQGLARRE